MSELSDEELEKRMRAVLLGDGAARPSQAFSDADRRVAEKLLGKDETRRLESRRSNTKPFRPKKPVVVAEYYEVPPMQCHWSAGFGGGWRIDIRVNGRLHRSKEEMSRETCLKVLASLTRRGVEVKEVITEWMKSEAARLHSHPAPKPVGTSSKRREMLDEIAHFKIGGC